MLKELESFRRRRDAVQRKAQEDQAAARIKSFELAVSSPGSLDDEAWEVVDQSLQAMRLDPNDVSRVLSEALREGRVRDVG